MTPATVASSRPAAPSELRRRWLILGLIFGAIVLLFNTYVGEMMTTFGPGRVSRRWRCCIRSPQWFCGQ